MRSLLVAVAASAAFAGVASASVITQWDFNDAVESSGGTLTPSTGAGTASLVGANTGTFGSGVGSSDTAGATFNDSWLTTTYAAQGTGSNSRGVRFDVSTVGYNNISFCFDQRNSNTASRYWLVEYSLDGSSFSSAGLAGGGVYAVTVGGVFVNGFNFDMSTIVGADNNASFAVRITAIFAPGTSAYATTSGTGTYGTTGTARWDMVTMKGDVVPGPGALALLGVAGVLGSRRRRA